MRKWRKNSEFGTGRLVPLDSGQRDKFRAMLTSKCFRRIGGLTITAVSVARVMLGMQGKNGRLDPSIKTLAARTGVDPSTVVRALARLRECGFVAWVRRLVRHGSRVEQTSNAYVLTVPGTPELHFASRVVSKVKVKAYGPIRATIEAMASRLTDEEAQENAARQLAQVPKGAESLESIRKRRNAALNASRWNARLA